MKRIKKQQLTKSTKPDPIPEGVRIEHIELDTRPLVVVDMARSDAPVLKGAIVWVKPAKGSTPEQVAAIVETCRASGAVRVLAMPREAEDAPVPQATHEQPVKPNATIREVVDELVSEVREQQALVREIVDLALSQVGL